MLIIGNCEDKIYELKLKLGKMFAIKDLGEPKCFLGLEIVRNIAEKKLFIH